jgi:signal transduction histidine kinase
MRAIAWDDAALRAGFADHVRDLMARRFQWLALFLLAAGLLWWPFDWLLLPPGSPAIAIQSHVRLGLVPLVALFLLVARLTPWVRRAPVATGAATTALGVAFAAWHLALLGGVDSPWFSFQFFVPFLTVAFLGPLAPRTALAVGVAGLMFGVYAARAPAHLTHPLIGVAVGQLAFATAFAVGAGHALYVLTWREYAQRRRLSTLNETLGEQVAAQTRDLRALTRRLTTAVQEERAFMAREVHDQLGQELTAMRYAIAFARGRAAEAPGPVRAALDELDQLLGRTRETTRRIIGRLRPRLLDDLGFLRAAREAVRDHGARTGMVAALHTAPEDLDVPAALATPLFEVLLEALTNVARHSHAQHVTVTLAGGDGRLAMVVEDDGVGLHAEHVPSASSVGLIGVRERIGALDGAATWGPGRGGGGFRLAVDVPLPSPAAAEAAAAADAAASANGTAGTT